MTRRETTPQELRQLTEHFRALGVDNPESWAKSQLQEGIPQYARLVFLRQAWKSIVAEGETAWIDKLIALSKDRPQAPGAGIGPALTRILAAGACREDIGEVVRVMQWQLLFSLTYLLSDPGTVDYPSKKLPHANWALFEVDENGNPLHPISGLHESVLGTDPSGREMRPKDVGREG
jgi:hypothetical protein